MKESYKFNLNSPILVKLTDLGYARMAEIHNAYIGKIPNWDFRTAEYYRNLADTNNGYTRFSAWQFMKDFGEITGMASPSYYSTEIIIQAKDLYE